MPQPVPHTTRPQLCLAPDEFADRYRAAARCLWVVAAGVPGGAARAQIEDALQEACVIALGKLDQFDRNTSFEAWMGRIVRFVSLNQARRRSRHAASSGELLETCDGAVAAHGGEDVLVGERGELLHDQDHFDDEVQAPTHGQPEPPERAAPSTPPAAGAA